MKAKTLLVRWTGKTTKDPVPINTLDFHPGSGLLVTGAADLDIQIWRVTEDEHGMPSVEHVQSLEGSQRNVNCVRWSPTGNILVSAGDTGELILWKPEEEKNENDETVIRFRKEVGRAGHKDDIQDLAWAPDATAFVTCSIDNSVLIWDAHARHVSKRFVDEHGHYVQGVSWDPRGTFLTSTSCDRSLRTYGPKPLSKKEKKERAAAAAAQAQAAQQEAGGGLGPSSSPAPGPTQPTCIAQAKALIAHAAVKSRRFPPEVLARHAPPPSAEGAAAAAAAAAGPSTGPAAVAEGGAAAAAAAAPAKKLRGVATTHQLFHDENDVSFFRRMGWSPDGALLAVPAGTFRRDPTITRLDTHVTYLFARRQLDQPVAMLPALKTPTAVARFCPRFFRRDPAGLSLEAAAALPYRMIVAAASQDTVLLYETQGMTCVATVGGLHLSTITDLAWSRDGRMLAASSRDGYCSIIKFEEGELGEALPLEALPPHIRAIQPEVRFAGQPAIDLTNFRPAVAVSTGPFAAPQLIPGAQAAAAAAPVRGGASGAGSGGERQRITPVPIGGAKMGPAAAADPNKKRIAPTPVGASGGAGPSTAAGAAPVGDPPGSGAKKRIAPTPLGATAAPATSPKRPRTQDTSAEEAAGPGAGAPEVEKPMSPLKLVHNSIARMALALVKKPAAAPPAAETEK